MISDRHNVARIINYVNLQKEKHRQPEQFHLFRYPGKQTVQTFYIWHTVSYGCCFYPDGIAYHLQGSLFPLPCAASGLPLSPEGISRQQRALFKRRHLLIRAFQADREIKYIIRALDYNDLVVYKDAYDETFRYPYYLYNDNPFDDVRYVLNKSVLLNETMSVVKAPDGMGSAVNFDTYANWNSYYSAKFGARYVLATYRLRKEDRPPRSLTQEERQMLLDNLRQNVTLLADEHPETDFYLYFPPYSICYWDILHNQEETDWHLEAEQLAIEELLKHPNIRLYSFCDNFELVCNLDHYKDYLHYSEQVNTWILENLKGEEYLLTEDNYLEYLEKIRDFYHSYDYDALHSS